VGLLCLLLLLLPQVSEIKPEWLVEIAPHYYSKKDIADDERNPKRAWQECCSRGRLGGHRGT